MAIAATAAEAFERYKGAFDAGLLTQASWHTTADDGRNLACALGVIGDEIGSARDCPAQIMPRWLAQMVPWFFDNQPLDDAKSWGLKFYAELKRLNGVVPFSVVHDWHASVAAPVAIEMAEKRKRDPSPHIALQAVHKRALSGDLAKRDKWASVLRLAYAYAYAYAKRKEIIARYADGMVQCLARVSPEVVS